MALKRPLSAIQLIYFYHWVQHNHSTTAPKVQPGWTVFFLFFCFFDAAENCSHAPPMDIMDFRVQWCWSQTVFVSPCKAHSFKHKAAVASNFLHRHYITNGHIFHLSDYAGKTCISLCISPLFTLIWIVNISHKFCPHWWWRKDCVLLCPSTDEAVLNQVDSDS